MPANTPPSMPLRGERIAPVFKSSEPREAGRYFEDLDDLFTRCEITTDKDKKKWATRYPDMEASETWMALPEYAEGTQTEPRPYESWKDAVLALYPGAVRGSRKYYVADFEAEVTKFVASGPFTREGIAAFERRVKPIYAYLLSKHLIVNSQAAVILASHVAPARRARFEAKLDALEPALEAGESPSFDSALTAFKFVYTPGGLGLFDPDRQALARATSEIVQGFERGASKDDSRAASVPPNGTAGYVPVAPANPYVKREDIPGMLATALEQFYTNSSVGRQLAGSVPPPANPRPYQAQDSQPAARPFQNNYPSQNSQPAARSFQSNYPPPPMNPSMVCLWDGCSNFLRNCPDVRLHLDTGHVKRNDQNQLVLPNGEMIPREPRGRNLKERALAWHAANPNHLVKDLEDAHEAHFMAVQMGQMLLEVDRPPAASTFALPAVVREIAKAPVAKSTPSYQLPLEERARLLQLETARLAQLKQEGATRSGSPGEPPVGSLSYGLRSGRGAPPAPTPSPSSGSGRQANASVAPAADNRPHTRARAAQQPPPDEDEEEEELPRSLAQAQAKAKEIAARYGPVVEELPPPLGTLRKESEVVSDQSREGTPPAPSSTGATTGGAEDVTIHPFRHGDTAVYGEQQARELTGDQLRPSQPSRDARGEPAYRNQSGVHDPSAVGRVVRDVLDTQITIRMRDLVAVAPEVRSGIRSEHTNRRVPTDNAKPSKVVTFDIDAEGDTLYVGPPAATIHELAEVDVVDVDVAAPVLVFEEEAPVIDDEGAFDDYGDFANLFAVQPGEYDSPPAAEGAVFLVPMEPSPYATFNSDVTPSQLRAAEETVLKANADRLGYLQTAKRMGQIRAVKTIVNNTLEHHAILDPGAMVVAMSEACAIAAELTWDESKNVSLQSANNSSNTSLGEASNVPFTFGGSLTIYLQVQIVREPAYDILLGRPFDILVNSVVRNIGDQQTITITDPNRHAGSTSSLTIPTVARKPTRFRAKGGVAATGPEDIAAEYLFQLRSPPTARS